MSKKISAEKLDELEKKYASPVHTLLFKTDDSKAIYVLKEGREGSQKIGDMFHDIHELIRELKRCVT